MTASAEEEVLVTVSETLGSAAGKVVAGAKRTANSLGEEKDQLVRVATKVRSKARRAIKKSQKKAKKVTRSENRHDALFANRIDNGQLHTPSLDIQHGRSRITLGINSL